MESHPPEHAEQPPEGGTAETQWYVAVADQVFGPADKAEFTQWVAEGRVPANAQVSAVGGDEWTPLSGVAELRDLPFPPPPPPAHIAHRPQAKLARSGRQLSPCPHCEGPVHNVAPAYGWPWGLFQRSLKPSFGCGQCGATVEYDQLTPTAQAQVTRSLRVGFAIWLAITAGLIAFIGLCVFMALSSFY